jgi:16S rRNA (uracil1498-N3)-methyltransferase
MQVFYSDNISDGSAIFNSEESQHCIRVLRLRQGENITFTDGKGNMYDGEITSADFRKMEAKIISVAHGYGKREYHLHMAVSPLKNHDRFEWYIEKAVEMGIDEITPLICERTEKQTVKGDRLRKLIISAMKQSVKAYLPSLHETMTFSDFVNNNFTGTKIIAHCNSIFQREPVTSSIQQGENITILIGPEGDFTEKEIEDAINHGFRSVSLGESRLRTETAGIVACCSAYLANI